MRLSASDFGQALTQPRRRSKLTHPNIVLFIGVSITPSGDRYIVTEYLSRGSVWDILHPKRRRSRPIVRDSVNDLDDDDDHEEETLSHSVRVRDLTPERVQQMLLHTARGMTYLHSLKPPIIHRDLKSQNLLVDQHWLVKIADFGLARLQSAATMTATGTPQWSAPEVIRHEHYSTKADVYSFGVIIFELLTSKIPYLGMAPLAAAHTVAYKGLRPKMPDNADSEYTALAHRVCCATRAPLVVISLTGAASDAVQCWAEEPDDRPSYPEIVELLESLAPPLINTPYIDE